MEGGRREEMSETDNNSHDKQAQTCIWAIGSLWIALAGILALFLFLHYLKPAPESWAGHIVLTLLGLTFLVSMPLAFVLGAVGLFRIYMSKGRLEGRGFALAGIVLPAVAVFGFLSLRYRMTSHASGLVCGTNLRGLGSAIKIYASEFDDQYPTPDKWCDLLADYARVTAKQFVCKGAAIHDSNARCHYAMNLNCEPNSPPDMVLLFETNGGWNQSGGPEILTTENHGGKGCNVFFSDCSVRFVPTEELRQLKWKKVSD
jgi:hypothetical protein